MKSTFLLIIRTNSPLTVLSLKDKPPKRSHLRGVRKIYLRVIKFKNHNTLNFLARMIRIMIVSTQMDPLFKLIIISKIVLLLTLPFG